MTDTEKKLVKAMLEVGGVMHQTSWLIRRLMERLEKAKAEERHFLGMYRKLCDKWHGGDEPITEEDVEQLCEITEEMKEGNLKS